jgi:hypothetical protein
MDVWMPELEGTKQESGIGIETTPSDDKKCTWDGADIRENAGN